MENNNFSKTVKRVGITTITLNAILSLGKIIGGILAKSSSLISDGVHSASDVLSTFVVMIGVKLSNKAPDKDHPFGHERIESIASVILAILLFLTAIGLGYGGVTSIIDSVNSDVIKEATTLTYVALSFAFISIIVKGWMYFYTLKAAKKINSTSLKADAFHHLTDSLSSIGSFVGIIGLLLGGKLVILDPIASILIAIFIIKVSVDIAKEGFNQLVDKAAPEEFENEILSICKNNKQVKRINSLKTRIFGSMYYIELEIAVDDNLTVLNSHTIAKELHDEIEKKYSNVKHCMIHIDPYSIEKED